jgi:hypothetical protein
MEAPAYVTLFVYRVTARVVRAHEVLGDACLYVGDVTLPRARLPRVRAGERVRIRIA